MWLDPYSFCHMCLLTFGYLSESRSLIKNKSPYELMHQKSPDYSHFRIFGCLAFASTLASHWTKFLPRARMCIFLGYRPGMKGYKLFDVNNKEIFVSRDVVFHESVFPFLLMSPSESIIDPFPIVFFFKTSKHILISNYTEENFAISPELVKHSDMPNYSTGHSSSTQTESMRISTRVSRQPSYQKDYHYHFLKCNSAPLATIRYPLSNYISYNTLSSSHKNFVLNVSSQFEP